MTSPLQLSHPLTVLPYRLQLSPQQIAASVAVNGGEEMK